MEHKTDIDARSAESGSRHRVLEREPARPRLGSLFSGYGGLDMGVQVALGDMDLAWVSDIEPGPCAILTRHHPGVTNLGDITSVDWTDVEPVDVIAGGSPCQDLSVAGARAGMRPGRRSGLWESMFHAISTIRPHLVVWENVRGALSAPAFSLMESREGRVGEHPDEPVLRALGRVLGDLAGIGYDAQWVGLRASEVGAPHQRFRVFVAAHPQGDTWWLHQGDHGPIGDSDSTARGQLRESAPGQAAGRRTRPNACRPDRAPVTLLPTPTVGDCGGEQARSSAGYGPPLGEVVRLLPTPIASDANGPGISGTGGIDLRTAITLLPTPMTSDAKGKGTADFNRNTPQLRALPMLLPTPSVADVEGGRKTRSGDRNGELLLNGIAAEQRFGQYAPAIHRWEQVTRPAPSPTIEGARGGRRLSPLFVEWMMGLPLGHVTDPDIWINAGGPASREWFAKAFQGISLAGAGNRAQLHALGNGVVPQQAAEAVRFMRARESRLAPSA